MEKEETLEEAGKRCFEEMLALNPKGGMKAFVRLAVNFGADWQAKRMYTEKNIIDILLEYTFSNECFEIREGMCSGFEKEEILRWFEQYKKEKL